MLQMDIRSGFFLYLALYRFETEKNSMGFCLCVVSF